MSAPLTPRNAEARARIAGQEWRCAMGGFRSYSARLRRLAIAADHQGEALSMTHLAGIVWQPREGAAGLTAPHEMLPEHRPDAPPALWRRLERALADLGERLEGNNALAAAGAFTELALAARDLADAIDATGAIVESDATNAQTG